MKDRKTALVISLCAIGVIFLLGLKSPVMASDEVITTGLVFEKGRFVEPPYTVTVARYDSSYKVTINGFVIDEIQDCPSAEPFVYSNPGPYSIPEGVDGLQGFLLTHQSDQGGAVRR